MLDVEIDIDTWGVGLGKFNMTDEGPVSCLYNPDTGDQCCLGFVGKVLGYTHDDLSRMPTPAFMLDNKWPAELLEQTRHTSFFHNTDGCQKLIRINDKENTPLRERIEAIIAAGEEVGINFTFK